MRSHFLRNLLTSWPVRTVDTDEEINGGDVVEWLGELREGIERELAFLSLLPPAPDVRSLLKEYSDTSWECAQWDRSESDESWEDVYARHTAAERALCAAIGVEPFEAPPQSKEQAVSDAISHLRIARDLLKQAGAPKTLARVRSALSSAKGALRHARLAPFREERQAKPKKPRPWTVSLVNELADKEGWGLFATNIYGDGGFELERDDEAAIFETDYEAWLHVAKAAREGKQLHVAALRILARENPEELEQIAEWLDGVHDAEAAYVRMIQAEEE